MKYYTILIPGKKIITTTSIRSLKDLPANTKITANITEGDGSLVDCYDIPVVDGKPKINRKKVHQNVLAK